MIDRIVVGVDGSVNASDALEWAIELASETGAEVVAVHAVGLRESHDAHVAGHREDLRERFEQRWTAMLDAAAVPSRRVLVDGDPVSVLLRTAEDEQADLVVVGSRGVGDRPELLLGSTSSQVMQRCARPVVVIPRC